MISLSSFCLKKRQTFFFYTIEVGKFELITLKLLDYTSRQLSYTHFDEANYIFKLHIKYMVMHIKNCVSKCKINGFKHLEQNSNKQSEM